MLGLVRGCESKEWVRHQLHRKGCKDGKGKSRKGLKDVIHDL